MVSRGGVVVVGPVEDGIPEPELEVELGEGDGGSGRGKSGRIWSAGIEYGILFRTSGRVWVFVDRVGCTWSVDCIQEIITMLELGAPSSPGTTRKRTTSRQAPFQPQTTIPTHLSYTMKTIKIPLDV